MGVKHSKKTSKKSHKTYHCPQCSLTFHHKQELTLHALTCTSKQKTIKTSTKSIPETQASSAGNSVIAFDSQRVPPIRKQSNPSFDSKVKEFRSQLSQIKIDWREGSNTIEVERALIVAQSMKGFQRINPLKELKIEFKGEVSYDAGGLIREWLTILFSHFLDEKNNLFIRTETDDISYLVKPTKDITCTLLEAYYFIGKLIGKALLENLTVNCCFNKLIYKLILEENVQLEELVFIDKPLYHSLKEILKMKGNIEDLFLFFSIEYEDINGSIKSDNLILNGNSVQVTKDNLSVYIQKRIEHLVNSQEVFVDEIRKGINSIIPMRFMKGFSSDEFALVLNGTPFIDLEDWKNHTVYKDYQRTDPIINEFWVLMSTLSQDDLSKFLQFCTGSSRVPIGGFSSLESNRGNKAIFCITKGNYYPNQVNYIKAHTCFNRLDLPEFPDTTQLKASFTFILRNEAIGFGID